MPPQKGVGAGGLLLACLLMCVGDARLCNCGVPGMRPRMSFGLAQSERAFCVYAGLRHPLYLDFMHTLAKGA